MAKPEHLCLSVFICGQSWLCCLGLTTGNGHLQLSMAEAPTPNSPAQPARHQRRWSYRNRGGRVKSLCLLALLVPAMVLGTQRVMVVEELTRAGG